ncbi:MAG: hypothetical protein AB1782_10065 [Cyanobacteriota bacterium]
MKKLNAHVVSIVFLTINFLALTLTTVASQDYYQNNVTIYDSSRNLSTELIAECNDCINCGKDVEKLGDYHYKNGDYASAKNAYEKAVNIYQQSLTSDSNNRCVRNGLKRVQYKLHKFSQ